MNQNEMRLNIIAVCDELKELLLAKNASYGNSVAEPINVFFKGTPEEGVFAKIDDKLKRIACGSEYQGDDTTVDLTGYLILLLAMRRATCGQ